MSVFRRLMEASNCVIVSPDYRLSLEVPYPAGLEDCYDALLWMKEHAKELGIRENQIATGGDSSGASFAVSLTMMARVKSMKKITICGDIDSSELGFTSMHDHTFVDLHVAGEFMQNMFPDVTREMVEFKPE